MSKRLLAAALIALVATVVLLVSSPTVGARLAELESAGVSAAGSSPNNPQEDIQQGNFFCGADLPALPVIGFTNFHRTGNTVSINFHLRNAIPNATYQVSLWGAVCSFFGVVDTVTTNRNGVANASGSVTVPSLVTRFFATGLGPNGFNDTPAVILLP
jgi:hypothetical protein